MTPSTPMRHQKVERGGEPPSVPPHHKSAAEPLAGGRQEPEVGTFVPVFGDEISHPAAQADSVGAPPQTGARLNAATDSTTGRGRVKWEHQATHQARNKPCCQPAAVAGRMSPEPTAESGYGATSLPLLHLQCGPNRPPSRSRGSPTQSVCCLAFLWPAAAVTREPKTVSV
ncbi:hypothetical protein NDU88_001297 [Pleurodeles waltl]|uniref:Uncharacterized protein n=1 Tax=Pleurodeles waltl TaxID=8319 RepID=A0AAV7P7I6_PLEWA|nr:hypothetical protein NDU88_001297 [Pleurodeles waltl]